MKHKTKAKTKKPVDTDAATDVAKGIHKIVFSKDHFTSKAAVTKALTAEGYTGRTVEETRKSFVAHGIAESAFERIDPVPVTSIKGMTVHVGVLKEEFADKAEPEEDESEEESEDEDDEEDEEEGESAKTESANATPKGAVTEDGPRSRVGFNKAPRQDIKPPTPIGTPSQSLAVLKSVTGGRKFLSHVRKMDWYEAKREGVKSIREALQTGDPTLPGFNDVSSAFGIVVCNILKDDEPVAEALDAALDEFTTYIRRLAKNLTGVENSERDEVIKKALELAPEEDEDDVNRGAQFEDVPLTKAEKRALEEALSKDEDAAEEEDESEDESEEDETEDESDTDEDSEDEDEREDEDEDSEEEDSEDESEEEDDDEEAEDEDEDETPAVAKAVARVLNKSLATLTAGMKTEIGKIAKKTDANFERLESQMKDGQKRLIKLEHIEQTPKGQMSDESTSVTKSERPKQDAAQIKLNRNLLGC